MRWCSRRARPLPRDRVDAGGAGRKRSRSRAQRCSTSARSPARPFYAIFVVAYYALFAVSENIAVFVAARGARRGRAGDHLGPRRDRARRRRLLSRRRTRDRRSTAPCRGRRREPSLAFGWPTSCGTARGVHAAAGADGAVSRCSSRWPLVARARPPRDVARCTISRPAAQCRVVLRRGIRDSCATRTRLMSDSSPSRSRSLRPIGGAPALARRRARRAALGRRGMGDPDPRRADPVRRISRHRHLGRRSRRHGLDRRPARGSAARCCAAIVVLALVLIRLAFSDARMYGSPPIYGARECPLSGLRRGAAAFWAVRLVDPRRPARDRRLCDGACRDALGLGPGSARMGRRAPPRRRTFASVASTAISVSRRRTRCCWSRAARRGGMQAAG